MYPDTSPPAITKSAFVALFVLLLTSLETIKTLEVAGVTWSEGE
jgi:hypothetical protein